jgi:[NiFe] hydrogenase assembly HybE family chaperone
MPNPHSANAADARVQQRTQALVRLFEEVASTRMQGVPILNPALAVQALGFVQVGDQVQGVLITPWFMNLVNFPLERQPTRVQTGSQQALVFGDRSFDFITGHEDAFGSYASCSLFSPMFEFPDQNTAVTTANAVLTTLRAPKPVAQAPAAPEPKAVAVIPPASEMPARRAFFLARRSGPAGSAAT